MKDFLIRNVNIITPEKIIGKGSVSVSGGIISGVYENSAVNYSGEIIEGNGLYLSAGFVDMHIHGGGGSDFMDGTPEAYQNIISAHRKHGTTSLLPTVLGGSYEEIIKAVNAYKAAKNGGTEGLLGIHIEGPYVAKTQAGALPVKYIRNPDKSEYTKIYEAAEGNILRWSFAPELDGSDELCGFLKERGVLPSIAHSEAEYSQAVNAFNNGYTLLTHLYSAMSTIKRVNGFRIAGLIESAYLIDDMNVEIIADGCHLPGSLLRYVFKFKNKDNIALITDAMRASGQNTKQSYLGSKEEGVPCIIEDGVAKLPDRSAFAGSIATADLLVRTMVKKAGVPLKDAVKMITVNPIKMLSLNIKKGRIEKGYDADIVLFDEDINIKKVFIKGLIS